MTTPVSEPYSCSQSLMKAVSKVKKALPSTPRRKAEVMKKLVQVSMPENARRLFSEESKEIKDVDLRIAVEKFYERDDISRQAPGIKDVKPIKDKISGEKLYVPKHNMIMT